MKSTIKQGVSCSVCGIQRAPGEIHPRESRLLKGSTLLICNPCDLKKMEPRAYVIIVARTKGFASVAEYIKNHRYPGPIISAKEII